ncbi:MAG: cellulase family glycosylhydrolase [Bacteroidota bacterium]
MQTKLTSVDNEADEFIRVASDGWNFETAVSQQPFIPWGVNYYDPATYHNDPYPAFDVIGKFDSTQTDRHFAKLDSLGVNIVRIFLSVMSFEPQYLQINESALLTLDTMIMLASKHNLRIIFDLVNDWEGWPVWASWDLYADDHTILGYEFYLKALGSRYAGEPAIFSWSLKNEPYIRESNSGIMLQLWPHWVQFKYSTEAELAASWSDYPRENESWEQIKAPSLNEFTVLNNPGDPRLFDFQLFREDIAYIWTRRLTDAMRAVDPNHLISVGLIQFSAPIKHYVGNSATYAAFNPIKLTPLLDYTSIHAYNWWGSNEDNFINGVARYSYASKPVMLEEYDLKQCNSSVNGILGSISGWLHWAAFAVPEWDWKDNLFDVNEQATSLGEDFNIIAGWIKEEIPSRAPDAKTVGLNLELTLTSVNAQEVVYNNYIREANLASGPVGFNVINYNSPLFLDLTAPAGGEQWTVGHQVQLAWDVIDLNILYSMTVDIQISRDGGKSWEEIASSIENTGSYQWSVTGPRSDSCLIAVNDHADGNVIGMNSQPFSIDWETGMELPDEDPSAEYKLAQNYPNPFNQQTTIAFDLPQPGIVTLKVFDLLGQEVALLESGHYQAGNYRTIWNAAGLPGGVYIYEMQAGTYVEKRRLILLR